MSSEKEAGAAESPTVLEPSTLPTHTIFGLAPPPVASTPLRRQAPRNLEGTELLDRYEVEGVIGEGGMATVYRGRHKAIQKPVAIKVLDDALEWRLDGAERFLQEAQITSRVVHENVVEVTDFGTTADGVVFCVMELLQGESLADFIESAGPLPLARAAEIMRQVCGALEAAHGHGIIHRDLKPANCFRTPRTSNVDFVKLLDFGIARVARSGNSSHDLQVARPLPTQFGFIIGTPDYMAPEQAREEPFDHRVDVYAAGGLFFELLTGRKPYLGNSVAELLAAHLHLPVPDPGHLVPSLSPAVRGIVVKAMAKRADDRFASMAAMAEAIADAVAAEDAVALVLPRRFHRPAAAAFAVGVLALGGWFVSEPPVTTSRASTIASVADVLPAGVAARELAPNTPDRASPSSAPPAVAVAAVVPMIEPEPPLAEQAPTRAPTSAPKRKSPGRSRGDSLPALPEVPPPSSDATAPSADTEPLRARVSEVKDPFANEVGPVGAANVGFDERPRVSPTTVPDVDDATQSEAL